VEFKKSKIVNPQTFRKLSGLEAWQTFGKLSGFIID